MPKGGPYVLCLAQSGEWVTPRMPKQPNYLNEADAPVLGGDGHKYKYTWFHSDKSQEFYNNDDAEVLTDNGEWHRAWSNIGQLFINRDRQGEVHRHFETKILKSDGNWLKVETGQGHLTRKDGGPMAHVSLSTYYLSR